MQNGQIDIDKLQAVSPEMADLYDRNKWLQRGRTYKTKHDKAIESITADLLRLAEVIEDYTDWKPGKGIIPPIKHEHGNCCTCQKCGRHHDDCVCQHNEIERLLTPASAGKPKT